MTDIAKCAGLSANGDPCPQRESCWRYLAPDAGDQQGWCDIKWWPERGYCQDYEPVKHDRPS